MFKHKTQTTYHGRREEFCTTRPVRREPTANRGKKASIGTGMAWQVWKASSKVFRQLFELTLRLSDTHQLRSLDSASAELAGRLNIRLLQSVHNLADNNSSLAKYSSLNITAAGDRLGHGHGRLA